jgi:hypothetical protein
MYQRAFAIVTDEAYFPGAQALLNSIYAYYGQEYRVFVVGFCLRSGSLELLANHSLGSAITVLDTKSFAYPPVGAWEAKQCVLSHLCGLADIVCLLDADIVLLSRLDDVFDIARKGKIVSSKDGSHKKFDNDYLVYGPRIVGARVPYFNSGFLCLSLVRHWNLASLWEFTSRFARYSPGGGHPYSFPGHGDQGVLNALVVVLDKQADLVTLPQEIWCNSAGWSGEAVDITRVDGPKLEVMHRRLGVQQRLLHSTGPKWWRPEGREHFGIAGDVLACFQHFERLCETRAPQLREQTAPLEIGVITCNRPGIDVHDTVCQLRRASFQERIHVFCEPGFRPLGPMPGVTLHHNKTQLGNLGNWHHCLQEMVAMSSADYFLISEDDVAYCRGARAALEAAWLLPACGFWSLYTPESEREFSRQRGLSGWSPLNRGWAAIGTQAICLPRASADRLLTCPALTGTYPLTGPTDAIISKFFLDAGILCYYHFPSLTEHLGRVSVDGRADHMALDFDPDFQ